MIGYQHALLVREKPLVLYGLACTHFSGTKCAGSPLLDTPKAKVGKVDASRAKGECPDPWQVSFPPPAARLVEEPPSGSSSLAPAIECD